MINLRYDCDNLNPQSHLLNCADDVHLHVLRCLLAGAQAAHQSICNGVDRRQDWTPQCKNY